MSPGEKKPEPLAFVEGTDGLGCSTSITDTTMIGSKPSGKCIVKNSDIDTNIFSAVRILLSGSDIRNVKKVKKITFNIKTVTIVVYFCGLEIQIISCCIDISSRLIYYYLLTSELSRGIISLSETVSNVIYFV